MKVSVTQQASSEIAQTSNSVNNNTTEAKKGKNRLNVKYINFIYAKSVRLKGQMSFHCCFRYCTCT